MKRIGREIIFGTRIFCSTPLNHIYKSFKNIILKFFLTKNLHFKVTGSVAKLDEVAKATIKASNEFLSILTILFLVQTKYYCNNNKNNNK